MLAALLRNMRPINHLFADTLRENPFLAFHERFGHITAIHMNGLRIAWVNSELKFPIPGIKGFARIRPLQKHHNMILNLGAGCIGRVLLCLLCPYSFDWLRNVSSVFVRCHWWKSGERILLFL